MTDDGTLPDRLRNMVRNPNAISTHSDACWQWHDDCALLLAADRVAERDAALGRAVTAEARAETLRIERDRYWTWANRAEAEARQLREAIREHKDRHNSWRQQTQRPSDIALWAALNAAAVAEGGEDRPKFPGLHDRPDTGEECHYLAVTMPHGGLFCNKCWWAEGAEDRGQTDG